MKLLLGAVLLALAQPSSPNVCPSQDDRTQLARVMADLAVLPSPDVNPAGTAIIEKVVAKVLEAARRHRRGARVERPYVPDELRFPAFKAVARLLLHSDPWVRGFAVHTLVRLDRRLSVPLLAAMVTDEGGFDYSDVLGLTVGEEAAARLEGLVSTMRPRVPVDELDCPQAQGRATQRWLFHHLPYLRWLESREWGSYVDVPLAIHGEVSFDRLATEEEERADLRQLLVISPNTEPSRPLYERNQAVPFGLSFQNVGRQALWVRCDVRDSEVHHFRLVRPDGTSASLRSADLPAPAREVPVLQWLPPDSGTRLACLLGIDGIQLDRVFDLSVPGTYRLHYSYVPPLAERRDAKEYDRRTELRFWEGRFYAGYYEFLIK